MSVTIFALNGGCRWPMSAGACLWLPRVAAAWPLVVPLVVGTILALVGDPARGGLVSSWEFEGNVSNAVNTSFNATAVNGPGYAAGVIGQAISLNGSNQYATVPAMGTYGSATVAVWIQTVDADSPGSQAIFHSENYTNGTPHFLLEYPGSPSPSITGLVIDVPTAGDVKLNGGNSSIQENTWYNVAYTYDPSGQSLRLYINGVLAGSTGSASMAALNLNNMVIGSGFNRPFNGLLDDLAVWNEALSANQMLGIYNFATSSLNYGQVEVAALYGLTEGQTTTTGDGATWEYATGLTGPAGGLESLGGGMYAMNLGGGTGVATVTPVPEPGPAGPMMTTGLLGLVGWAWRRLRRERV